MTVQRRLAREQEAASKQAGQPTTRIRPTSVTHLRVVPEQGDIGEHRPGTAADVVMSLARLVAEPGTRAWELLPDNTSGRHLPLRTAVDEAVAFFVVLADDILAADFDKADATKAADVLAMALRLRGLTPVVLASGQPGRRHVFARVHREDWMEELKDFAKELGGDARAAIRPPLSPHRLGRQQDVPVCLLAPATPSKAVRALSAASRSGSVSDRMWRVIFTGEGRDYASTSELVLAAACAVQNIGWGVEDFLELLEAEGSALAEAYADRVERRGSDATDWWLRSQIWPRAVSRVSDSPAIGVHDAERLSAMQLWALSRPWPGRGGAAEQAIYLALIDKASLTARLEFNASFRELAERAGISGLSTERSRRCAPTGWCRSRRRLRPSRAMTRRSSDPQRLGSCAGSRR